MVQGDYLFEQLPTANYYGGRSPLRNLNFSESGVDNVVEQLDSRLLLCFVRLYVRRSCPHL